MRIRVFAAAALGLVIQSAGVMAAEQRPQLTGVSAIRVANYGTPSTVIKDQAQVNAILDELRQLRNKAWRRADTKFSCYATLVLLRGERPVALFRIRPELVVERPQEKGQSSYSLATGQADLPRISTLLTGIPPAKDCN
jgi:hypothetical protein